MIGDEHCGLDDSWMVLLATQQLLKADADLEQIDLDAERTHILNANCTEQMLCLDGLPFFTVLTDLKPFIESHCSCSLPASAFTIVLGMDGRPSGRAIIDFGFHAVLVEFMRAFDGGRTIVCGKDPPSERLVLARPLRRRERMLLAKASGVGLSPAPFPADGTALAVLRDASGKGKGKSKGVCWQGVDCERSNCRFTHPEGRRADAAARSGGLVGQA